MIQKFSVWHKIEKRWLNPEGFALSGDGQIAYTGSIEDVKIVHCVGKRDRHGNEIREGDIMLVKMPEIEYDGSFYEEQDYTEKTIYGEVRIRVAGGLGLLIRKVIPDGDPGLKRGSFIRIREDKDEIVGHVFENPELIE